MALLGPLTLFLYTLSATSLVHQSASENITGFSLGLIHHDSPQSAFYNASATEHDRIREAIVLSISRHLLMGSTLPLEVSTPLSLQNYGYLMKVGIGTPFKEFTLALDTGGVMLWTQCVPCTSCFTQNDPIFDPSKSSTYQKVSCNDPICRQPPPCADGCPYEVNYAGGSHSHGTLSSETITFLGSSSGGSASYGGIKFGCGFDNAMNGNIRTGVAGFGAGPLSLVNQLSGSLGNKFSYCLSPKGTGTLSMGDPADISGSDVKATPIFQLQLHGEFFFLNLMDISVGAKRIGIPPGSFDPVNYQTGLFLDTSTVLTFLSSSVYNQLIDNLKAVVTFTPSARDPLNQLDLCYQGSLNDAKLGTPNITLHFTDNADWVVSPENLYLEVAPGVVCVAMKQASSISSIGTLMQRNMKVEYNLESKRMFFAPADCSAA
ncbi:aspartic proteinase CDR1 [Amborella trichopoda]|uniref:Peptidase A1 domain-containing protein n=1 Tax=Amborella trichopoda TaxID=13333 RepID=U5D933_AMBTC|nr:aspartic proteinase CDR1 [Amborella trichopoda]ERN16903.1 hypothetical protein AMTR_s00057p00166040 [Amborella trichopoda]|eukprot:XP_006855436.1 aspartic proteinase CDR1 [Amborella trichopoda]